MSEPRKRKRRPKRILALPDLEQSKAAVLNSLTSKKRPACVGWATRLAPAVCGTISQRRIPYSQDCVWTLRRSL